jgi:hypothetical protein
MCIPHFINQHFEFHPEISGQGFADSLRAPAPHAAMSRPSAASADARRSGINMFSRRRRVAVDYSLKVSTRARGTNLQQKIQLFCAGLSRSAQIIFKLFAPSRWMAPRSMPLHGQIYRLVVNPFVLSTLPQLSLYNFNQHGKIVQVPRIGTALWAPSFSLHFSCYEVG